MEIEVDSQLGLCLAVTNFIHNCSENMIPKDCDRGQLIINIEYIYHNMDKRSDLLKDVDQSKEESIVSKKFIDKRNGEIVTRFDILDIEHFDEVKDDGNQTKKD